MWLTVILVFALFMLLISYLRGKNNENYWKKRGVVFSARNKTGGPAWQYMIGSRSLFEIFCDIYKEFKNAPAVGIGSAFERALYVRDPTNINHITQADFSSFYHRGIPVTDDDLLAHNVLFLNGPKWKLLRHKLSPLFTSAKLKNMYYIIDTSAQDFVKYLKQNPDRWKGNASHIDETLSRFCTAALSAAVFGIGTKSVFDLPFRHKIKDAISPTFELNVKFGLGLLSNRLFQGLGLKFFGKHEKFFIDTIKQVIRQREVDNVTRHDFADMCVKLQKEGTMVDPDTGLAIEPTDELLAAQAFFFFIAGIDPCAATLQATLMELGRNPDILKRVHDEVDTVFAKYNNQLTYEAISEAEYLDRVLSESLRMYPPLGFITRQCVKDSTLPVGNIYVEKGVTLFLPFYEIHNDPKYYPNPEIFDPDRFIRKGEINDMTYMPFGKGNRTCIGARYARLQLMSGLIHFLRSFTVNTLVNKGGVKFLKEPSQVRVTNIDLEFIPRNF